MRPRLDRRRFGRLVLGAGLTAPYGFSRAFAATPGPKDELVVGVWGGVQERLVRKYCLEPLVKKYGCKVSLVLGGTPERRARAYVERGRPSFDIVYLNIYESRQAQKDGVTQAVSTDVPQAAHLYGIARKGGYGVALNPVTVIYDKRKARRPVTSWRDIWNPEWRGRIAWPQFPSAQGAAGLLMAARVWGGSEHAIDVGFQKVKELKPFPALATSQDQLYQMFDTGVCDLAIEFGSVSRKYAETRNPNLVVADLHEGEVAALNVACITVGARNQRLAEEWINLHLSAPCLEAYAQQTYYSPTVDNTPLPQGLEGKLIGPSQVGRLIDFDWDFVNANQRQWASRFNREIAG